MGNTFVSAKGFYNASQNQAGLGWLNRPALSMQHSRPYMMEEPGISSLGIQWNSSSGGFGISLSTAGITGLRQTSFWISYGMRLSEGIAAGLGIHLWTSSLPGQLLFHPGASFALGVQVKMNDQVMMGAHVLHPLGWCARLPVSTQPQMVLTAGFTYQIFETIAYSSDLQVMPLNQLRTCHGIVLNAGDRIGINMGMHNQPFAISAGISSTFSCYTILVAFEYVIQFGLSPISSVSYAWQ